MRWFSSALLFFALAASAAPASAEDDEGPTVTIATGPAFGFGNDGLRFGGDDGNEIVPGEIGSTWGLAFRLHPGVRVNRLLLLEFQTGLVRTTRGSQIRSVVPINFGFRLTPDTGSVSPFVAAHAGAAIDRRGMVLSGRPNRTIHRQSRWDFSMDAGFGIASEGEVGRRFIGLFYQRVFTDGSPTSFVEFVTGIWLG